MVDVRNGLAGPLLCGLAVGLSAVSFPAHSVVISEARFKELGGDLAAKEATFPGVARQLRAFSLAPQFLAVGRLGGCTATWLGEQGPHSFFLTASHCVQSTHGQATRNRLTFLDAKGRVIAAGEGWAVKPPKVEGDRLPPRFFAFFDDIAVVRLPRRSTPTDWFGAPLPPPVLAEDDLQIGEVVHFIGYGARGVGETYIHRDGEDPRMSGESTISAFFDEERGVYSPFQPLDGRSFSAGIDRGDSGSAWWRVRQGDWQVSAVTAGGNGRLPKRSSPWTWLSMAPQVSRYAAWIDGIFPGAVLQSERMSVTASAPFVSRNHVGDPSGQRVHFLVPSQLGVEGPADGRWSGATGFSMITVAVKETRTGATAKVRLRAHRDAGCRVLPIEDAMSCPGSQINRLKVAFRTEDNPGLKPGAYTGRFDVNVVAGLDVSRQERLTLRLDIRHLLRGQVSTTAAYASPNLAGHAAYGAVYYTVPAQERARGPVAGLWNGSDLPSRILVTVRDAVSGQEREIVLRARRDPLCGGGRMTRMEDAITCQRRSAGPVTVGFHREDNPHLPAGLHRGQVTLQANDWMDRNFHQLIELDVDLDTLDAAAGAAPDQAMARASPSP